MLGEFAVLKLCVYCSGNFWKFIDIPKELIASLSINLKKIPKIVTS